MGLRGVQQGGARRRQQRQEEERGSREEDEEEVATRGGGRARQTEQATAEGKPRAPDKVNFNRHYLCNFFTKSYT